MFTDVFAILGVGLMSILRKIALVLGLFGQVVLVTEVIADEIVVKGLLKNMVVLEVNGVQRTIKAGKPSPEGIVLISSNTKQAIVEIDGVRQTLQLSRRIGGVAYSAPEKTAVRIARGYGGHYFSPGRINNHEVQFLVDTGATAVVLNSLLANKLQIDYLDGQKIRVQTANGIATGYRVLLQNVSVGNVKLANVEAVINEGAYPTDILLGNSYLSRVDLKVDQGVMILQARY